MNLDVYLDIVKYPIFINTFLFYFSVWFFDVFEHRGDLQIDRTVGKHRDETVSYKSIAVQHEYENHRNKKSA